MQTTYCNAHSAAEVSYIGNNTYELNRIITERKFRGQGYGSILLKDICNHADQEQVILQLGIDAYGPMNDDMLRLWYGRNGFYHSINGFYTRLPN